MAQIPETIVIASHNAGKVREIVELLRDFDIQVLSATDAGIPEPEETGSSFEENANLKSSHAAAYCGKPSLADDSGLVVPAIGGNPGIYSARWSGPGKDFSYAMQRVKETLEKETIPAERWQAYFVCVLSLAFPDGSQHIFRGEVNGTLSFPPRGDLGFGYDPIFIPDGHKQTFGEMEPEEKQRISHRTHAFKKFVDFLEK